MTVASLEAEITRLAEAETIDPAAARASIDALLAALEEGRVRAVHPWVKRGILLAFRLGAPAAWNLPPFHFTDKDTLPTQDPSRLGRGIRVVPGGSSVRRGAYLGQGVVIMPPSYVNVGAYVGDHTMIDSHVLVGSCAQIGSRVHLSAGVQIGGVLEPVGATPVVVEDDAFVGGGCGLYEGSRVGRGAVLAPGVLLTRAVPLHDLVHGRTIRADDAGTLAVPERAVVVPGGRAVDTPFARERGIALYAPVIVKYRDAKTDAAAALEDALR